jgi:hypothetical protein
LGALERGWGSCGESPFLTIIFQHNLLQLISDLEIHQIDSDYRDLLSLFILWLTQGMAYFIYEVPRVVMAISSFKTRVRSDNSLSITDFIS